MKKIGTLLFVFLLAILSLAGFLFLNKKIEDGTIKLSSGLHQLEQGKKSLSEGQDALLKGEKQLSQGKRMYKEIKKSSVLAVAMAPVAGAVMLASDQAIKNKIEKGKMQIASGKEQIKSGKERLAKGNVELNDGYEKLKIAKILRAICAIGTVLLSILLIGLILYW